MRFKIRVTANEYKNLKQYLKENRYGSAINCSHAACKALNKTTGAWIPMPLSLSPAVLTLYFALTRLLPGSRVVSAHIKAGRLPKVVLNTGSELLFLVMALTPVGYGVYVVASILISNDD